MTPWSKSRSTEKKMSKQVPGSSFLSFLAVAGFMAGQPQWETQTWVKKWLTVWRHMLKPNHTWHFNCCAFHRLFWPWFFQSCNMRWIKPLSQALSPKEASSAFTKKDWHVPQDCVLTCEGATAQTLSQAIATWRTPKGFFGDSVTWLHILHVLSHPFSHPRPRASL